MAIIRKLIGSILLFLSWVFTPKGLTRSEKKQSEIDIQTSKMKLYQFNSCPFCIKVRRVMKRMSLNIETRDAMNNQEYRQELETHGGKIKVPCLRIENEEGNMQWMYESSEINKYLEEKFSI